MENLPSVQSAMKDLNSHWSISLDTLKKVQQGKRIDECDDQELAAELFKIYNLIGLRSQHYPNQIQDQMLFHYLRTKFGHKFKSEILHAFELAVFNHLDIDDINPYDQFSVAYMAKIMDAYRKHCNKLIKENMPESKPVELPPSVPTEADMKAELDEWKQKPEKKVHFIPLYLYDYMQKLGFNVEVTQKHLWKACMVRKNDLYNQAQVDPSTKNDYGEFLKMLDNEQITGHHKLAVQNLARKIIVWHYLND